MKMLCKYRNKRSIVSAASKPTGKLADLIVFDGDIMLVPIKRLDQIKPVLTIVGGKIAYESPDL